MDLEQVQRLAQAFAQGVAFARGFTEMAQDAKDGEEDGHWVTIGGERGADGEKHGGRPVFISGSGTIKKGLSKSSAKAASSALKGKRAKARQPARQENAPPPRELRLKQTAKTQHPGLKNSDRKQSRLWRTTWSLL